MIEERQDSTRNLGESYFEGLLSYVDQEGLAVRIIEAARRLENKYPVLSNLNSSVDLIRPRIGAICKTVSPDELDRKGSLLGGQPFLSQRFPVPISSRQKQAMAPLAQLDLDSITDAISEDVGSGLLQIWLSPGYWGSEPLLGDHYVRVIPNECVRRTRILLGHPKYRDGRLVGSKPDELEPLTTRSRPIAGESEQFRRRHYWDGVAGFDWTLSEFGDDGSEDEAMNTGSPTQIVGWEPSGFTIPEGSTDNSLWETFALDADILSHLEGLECEKDYKFICESIVRPRLNPICSLFDTYWGFHQIIYGPTIHYGEDSKSWDWKPLFAFPGPLSPYPSDDHMVFYRKTNDGFEYAGACRRWGD